MNRVATFLQAGTARFQGDIDSEWVYGHHLEVNGISVSRLLALPPAAAFFLLLCYLCCCVCLCGIDCG